MPTINGETSETYDAVDGEYMRGGMPDYEPAIGGMPDPFDTDNIMCGGSDHVAKEHSRPYRTKINRNNTSFSKLLLEYFRQKKYGRKYNFLRYNQNVTREYASCANILWDWANRCSPLQSRWTPWK